MSAYTKTKFVSKIFIYLSLAAIVFSGGAFLIQKNKIGADTQITESKNYQIAMDGNTVKSIMASDIQSQAVLNITYENTVPDISLYSDYCEISTENTESSRLCYIVSNKKSWGNPTIKLDENKQYAPVWAFLIEVRARAERLGDSDAEDKIKTVMTNYVADAFIKNLKPFLNFTATSGTILIYDHEFFDALDSAGIEAENDINHDVTGTGSDRISRMKFYPTYEGAKENSAWLAASEYVVESMIKPYKDAGLDAAEYEAAIEQARRNYISSISSADIGSNKILTLVYPQKLILDQKNETLFSAKIDTTIFRPDEGYKTKIFIKPASRKDDNVYILFGPFSHVQNDFSWAQATAGGYIGSNGQRANVSGADYDINYPQQYIIRAVTYQGDTEKDNVLATFETHTQETMGDGGTTSDISGSILELSAKPATVKQGNKVTATIEAINSNPPIKKVVLYACNGDKDDVAKNDSSSCTIKINGVPQDAVKETIQVDSSQFANGKATLTGSWQTSEFSTIGEHALMAKAFSAESGGYIEGSKTAVTINVTNSSVGAASADSSGSSGQFSNLLAGQFGQSAADSDTGSSIRTTGELINRIFNIFMMIIGALSVIAIIVGGIFYITAGGDQQKAEKGKKTVLYACIGIAIAVLTFVIENSVLDILSNNLLK